MRYIATSSDIKCFKDWLNQVPYLPQDYDEHVIRFFIEGSKGRMEVAKNKFDGFHRLRMEHPEILTNIDVDDPEFYYSITNFCYMTTPHEILSKCGSIITFHFPQPAPPNIKTMKNYYKYCQMGVLKILHKPSFLEAIQGRWNGKLCLITDLSNVNVSHMLVNPPKMLKGALDQMNNLPMGVESLHYINASPTLDRFISTIKSLTNKKISNRIHIHRDSESLKEIIGEKSLPSDYGGLLPSIKELAEQDLKWHKEVRGTIMNWESKLANLEKLRPKNAEDIIIGTFKKLQVD